MTTQQFVTDHRWAAGGSGANQPDEAIAAYAGRWIDYRDYADVVGDRQGTAYNAPNDAQWLAVILNNHNVAREGIRDLPRDETVVKHLSPRCSIAYRRAGGYIYVDAWLLPEVES